VILHDNKGCVISFPLNVSAHYFKSGLFLR